MRCTYRRLFKCIMIISLLFNTVFIFELLHYPLFDVSAWSKISAPRQALHYEDMKTAIERRNNLIEAIQEDILKVESPSGTHCNALLRYCGIDMLDDETLKSIRDGFVLDIEKNEIILDRESDFKYGHWRAYIGLYEDNTLRSFHLTNCASDLSP